MIRQAARAFLSNVTSHLCDHDCIEAVGSFHLIQSAAESAGCVVSSCQSKTSVSPVPTKTTNRILAATLPASHVGDTFLTQELRVPAHSCTLKRNRSRVGRWPRRYGNTGELTKPGGSEWWAMAGSNCRPLQCEGRTQTQGIRNQESDVGQLRHGSNESPLLVSWRWSQTSSSSMSRPQTSTPHPAQDSPRCSMPSTSTPSCETLNSSQTIASHSRRASRCRESEEGRQNSEFSDASCEHRRQDGGLINTPNNDLVVSPSLRR